MISMREMRIVKSNKNICLFSFKQNLSNPNTCNKSHMMSDILMLTLSDGFVCLFLSVAHGTSKKERKEKQNKTPTTIEPPAIPLNT